MGGFPEGLYRKSIAVEAYFTSRLQRIDRSFEAEGPFLNCSPVTAEHGFANVGYYVDRFSGAERIKKDGPFVFNRNFQLYMKTAFFSVDYPFMNVGGEASDRSLFVGGIPLDSPESALLVGAENDPYSP